VPSVINNHNKHHKLKFIKQDINNIDRQISTISNELASHKFIKNTDAYMQILEKEVDPNAIYSNRNLKNKSNGYQYKPYKYND